MTDYGYGTGDEELAEVRKLEADVQANPDEFENWEKLVRAVEGLEGGLNRNSSPQAITAARSIYDRFLAKFPLFFGYWKKYADLEFAIAGTEAAEMVRYIHSATNTYTRFADSRSRSMSAVLLALASRSISGPTTAVSRSRQRTTIASFESKFALPPHICMTFT